MCTHFRSYLRGAQFTLRTDHSSLRWLQRFRNGDGMLARWYLLLGQFSVTFEYRPGAQHANVDGMHCWRLQVGNLSIDTDGRLWRRRAPPAEGSQLVVPRSERRAMIRRFHDSLFAGHLGISRTVFRLQTRVYWPGLRQDVRTYVVSCTVCIARKSPCPRRAPIGHVAVGRRWERVAMDLLDMSITSAKGNRYVLVMVDCFSRWTEACPLSDKTAISVADAFFSNIVCRFGMPSVIHSDQGQEFENKVMHELCILGGSHKTKTRKTSRARMLYGSKTRWKWRFIRCADTRVRCYSDRNGYMISGRSDAYFLWEIG